MKKIFFLIIIFLTTLYSFDSYDFENLIGYTIIDVKKVDGDFEGCDYGKKIIFTDGTFLICNCYHYHYYYSPDAVILAKAFIYKGKKIFAIKMIIDDEIYDMSPIN